MKPTFDIENIRDILIESLSDKVDNPENVYDKISQCLCFKLKEAIEEKELDPDGVIDGVSDFTSDDKFETGVLQMDRKTLNKIVGEVVQTFKNLNVI